MADSTACDREPIHIPGTIQPFGVLFVLSEPELTITQVSENVSDQLSLAVENVLGQPLGSLLPGPSVDTLRDILHEERWATTNPSAVVVRGKPFDAIVHRHDGAAILELEPPAPVANAAIHHPFRAALMRVQRATTLHDLSEVVVEEMRRTTHFERVLFYRFHEDGSGSVDAEAKAPQLEPYLGLRYPASDIPAQARRLYVANWLRLIFDADQTPARIVPAMRPDTGAPLDLSFSVLRSVSPVHLEYMKNMGVRASMSVSLVVRGELWGLISCLNHTGPLRVSHEIRSACEFLGRLVSLQIVAFEDRERLAARASRRENEEALHRAMKDCTDDDVLTGLAALPAELLGLVGAGGAAVVDANAVLTCGRTPPHELVRQLATWLADRDDREPFATESVGDHVPGARAVADVASGLLAFGLPGGRVLWFRPELVQTVHWSGDPTKSMNATERLRPRHSFDLWKETVRFRARPWAASDLEAADELRRRAIEIDIERRLVAEQRAVRTRDELVAVVSHDLRAPLNVVQLQSTELLERLDLDASLDARSLRRPLERIARSAGRMTALVEDLLDLAKMEARTFPLDRRPLASRELIDHAVNDAQPLADVKRITLVTEAEALPPIEADPRRVSQVFANLIGNAIKFTPEGGQITMHAEPRDGDLSVTITDTGPGIAPPDLPHVFDRYWSAHQGGAGLGLYIARGIVEAHGGRIWANSSARGASFTFTLPFRPNDPELTR